MPYKDKQLKIKYRSTQYLHTELPKSLVAQTARGFFYLRLKIKIEL